MKKIVKIISFCLIISCLMCTAISSVYADWWGESSSWYSGDGFGDGDDVMKPSNLKIPDEAQKVVDEFTYMVNVVGTTVIVLVTIFLGIKYMFGSFEDKANVKESLTNLIVACIFFFGWNAIWNLLFVDGELVFVKGTDSYTSALANVFATLTSIANLLAVGAVLYIGIRYIFAGAQGKAELKGKSVQFMLGIILAFCSVGFLNYISKLINSVLR